MTQTDILNGIIVLSKIRSKKIRNSILNKINYKGGYLSNYYKDSFKGEYIFEIDSIDNIIKIIQAFISDMGISNVLMFHDGVWSLYRRLFNNNIVNLNVNKLHKFITKYFIQEGSYGLLNIYISDTKFNWIFTICNEKDIHLNGSIKLINKFKKMPSLKLEGY